MYSTCVSNYLVVIVCCWWIVNCEQLYWFKLVLILVWFEVTLLFQKNLVIPFDANYQTSILTTPKFHVPSKNECRICIIGHRARSIKEVWKEESANVWSNKFCDLLEKNREEDHERSINILHCCKSQISCLVAELEVFSWKSTSYFGIPIALNCK